VTIIPVVPKNAPMVTFRRIRYEHFKDTSNTKMQSEGTKAMAAHCLNTYWCSFTLSKDGCKFAVRQAQASLSIKGFVDISTRGTEQILKPNDNSFVIYNSPKTFQVKRVLTYYSLTSLHIRYERWCSELKHEHVSQPNRRTFQR
jgi:hypothetical protein